jgi:regulator of PEP synthase PpsR (kinase-PPPase family)
MGDSPVRVHLHLVSDSTGETVTTVARACVAQFEGVVPVEHVWSFVRSRAQVDQVLSMVRALPGVVIFTLLSPDLRQALYDGCRALNIPCVAVLDGVVAALSSLLGAESRPAARAGRRLLLPNRRDEFHAAP